MKAKNSNENVLLLIYGVTSPLRQCFILIYMFYKYYHSCKLMNMFLWFKIVPWLLNPVLHVIHSSKIMNKRHENP